MRVSTEKREICYNSDRLTCSPTWESCRTKSQDCGGKGTAAAENRHGRGRERQSCCWVGEKRKRCQGFRVSIVTKVRVAVFQRRFGDRNVKKKNEKIKIGSYPWVLGTIFTVYPLISVLGSLWLLTREMPFIWKTYTVFSYSKFPSIFSLTTINLSIMVRHCFRINPGYLQVIFTSVLSSISCSWRTPKDQLQFVCQQQWHGLKQRDCWAIREGNWYL